MMEPLLRVEGLKKHFAIPVGGLLKRRFALLKAVDDVTFSVPKGTCFGIAGESGSGKTTINKLILLSERPTEGRIVFDDKDITAFDRHEIQWYRRHVQPVFQDASSSLDPNMRICDIVAEPLSIQNRDLSKAVIRSTAEEMLKLVGLGSQNLRRYPHELSGGQKQRVAIARAMIVNPSLVILDEPVSALDVSIRAQILNLLADIQEEKGLTYIVIAHDLAMLRQVTTHIAVMYLGKIVEMGDTDEVLHTPPTPTRKDFFRRSRDRSPTGRRTARPSMGRSQIP
jgi:oligopeptide transport system ATP-binding protein